MWKALENAETNQYSRGLGFIISWLCGSGARAPAITAGDLAHSLPKPPADQTFKTDNNRNKNNNKIPHNYLV